MNQLVFHVSCHQNKQRFVVEKAEVECPHLQLHCSCVIDGNFGLPAGFLVSNGGNYQLLLARPEI